MRNPTIAVLGLVAAMTGGPVSPAEQTATQTQGHLDAVVERLNDLATWFDDAAEQRLAWLNEIEDADREVARVGDRIASLARELAETESALAGLEARIADLDAASRRQAGHIADHLAAAYRLGGQDFVKMLLNQQSAEEVTRMVRYHRHFTDARVAAITEYRNTASALEAARTRLAETTEALDLQRAAMDAERADLVERRAERRQTLARLDAQMSDKAGLRDRLDADRERLERLLETLRRRETRLDGTAFAGRKGALPWPVAGRIEHRYGESRSGGRQTWHGARFEAPEGTEVRAVFTGRVAFADWLRGYGLLTILNHGGGYMTLYGHADTLIRTVGDLVEGGETIALAGQSGGQTTSGLYFEVRLNGRPLDPMTWVTSVP